MHDIENYNKNGVFFHERNKVYEYEQIQSNSVYRDVRDIDFPIKGNVYENSADYYRKRNISQSELNKTKENWNNKRIEREEREHKVLNDIKRVKNITVFDKKFDSFWLNELDVELVGSKKDKNGNTILIVNDYGNNLNKIKNQNLIKRYGKNGIKFEKSFVGKQASTLTSLYEYERLKYNYPNEYTDFFTTAPFYYTLKKAQEGITVSAYINDFPTEGKNLSNSKEGYVSNDKKSSGSKMNNKEFEKINKEVLETVETNKKRNINVELHKKINEREEGYYFKKQFEKIELDIETKYKNIRAVNEINRGNLPENPVTEISRSINSRNAAKDFAIRLLGRKPTMEEWMRGNKIKINGKICYNCWIASEKGRTVTYRPSGWASGRTSDNASSVDLNDNGVFKKFKFEQK